MAATACSAPATFFGTPLPKVWRQAVSPARRSRFGDLALLAFLLAQCLDGVFTYVGVVTFGIEVEANPIIASVMTHVGHGPGLTGAKLIAAALGIGLHLHEVHGAVAVLTCLYLAVAVAPWTVLLFV